jgi:hypothetical protein
LDKVDALSGVEELGAGFEAQMHFLVWLDLSKVGKPGGMAEAHARGDGGPGGVVDDCRCFVFIGLIGIERLGKLLGDRQVEVKLAALDQLHDISGEDALGDGGGPEGGLSVHRQCRGPIGSLAAEAKGCAPDELAVVENSNLGAGDVVSLECLLGEGFGFRDGDLRTVQATDRNWRRGESGKGCREREQNEGGKRRSLHHEHGTRGRFEMFPEMIAR